MKALTIKIYGYVKVFIDEDDSDIWCTEICYFATPKARLDAMAEYELDGADIAFYPFELEEQIKLQDSTLRNTLI